MHQGARIEFRPSNPTVEDAGSPGPRMFTSTEDVLLNQCYVTRSTFKHLTRDIRRKYRSDSALHRTRFLLGL
jgi:hypothetical protein